MNLDRTFCINKDCQNEKCSRRLSYSVVRAAEKAYRPLSTADLKDSHGCEGYIEGEESIDTRDPSI